MADVRYCSVSDRGDRDLFASICDRKKAKTTGKLERSESQNDQVSRNDQEIRSDWNILTERIIAQFIFRRFFLYPPHISLSRRDDTVRQYIGAS
jgi:hypothetical protein